MANENSIETNKVGSLDFAKQQFIQSIANPYEKLSTEGKVHTLNIVQENNAFIVAQHLIDLADSNNNLATQYYLQAVVYLLMGNVHLTSENLVLEKLYYCLDRLLFKSDNVSNVNDNQLSLKTTQDVVNKKLIELFADNFLAPLLNQQIEQVIAETKVHPFLLGKILFHLQQYDMAYKFLDHKVDIVKVLASRRGDAEAYYCLGYLKYFIQHHKIISLQFLFASALLKNVEALKLLETISDDTKAHEASRKQAKSYLAQIYTRQLSDISVLKMGEFSDGEKRREFFEKQMAVIKTLIQDDETFAACVKICTAWDVKEALGRFALENSASSENEPEGQKLLSRDSFILSLRLIAQDGFGQDALDLIKSNYLSNPDTRTETLIRLIDFYLRELDSSKSNIAIPYDNKARDYVNELVLHYLSLIAIEKKVPNLKIKEIKEIVCFMDAKVQKFLKWTPMPLGLNIFKLALSELELGQLQEKHLNRRGNIFNRIYNFELYAVEILRGAHHPLVQLLITTACSSEYENIFISDMKACFSNNQFLLQFYSEAIKALNSPAKETQLLKAFEFLATKTEKNGFPDFLLACHDLITQKAIDVESVAKRLRQAGAKGCSLAIPLVELLVSKEVAKIPTDSILNKTGKFSQRVKKILENGSWVGKGKSMNDVVAGLVKQLELIEANGSGTSKAFQLPTSKLEMFFACVKAFMDKSLSEYIQPNLALVIYDLARAAQQESFKNFQPAANPGQNPDQNNNNNAAL
jgi:hypothetical protein